MPGVGGRPSPTAPTPAPWLRACACSWSVLVCLCRHSSVYWTESSYADGSSLYRHDSQTTHVILGPSSGADVTTRSESTEEPGCSCPAASVSQMFAVDATLPNVDNYDALFVWHEESGEIWTSDRHGCRCRLLRGATLAQPHIGTCLCSELFSDL